MKPNELEKTFEVGFMLGGEKRYMVVSACTAWEAAEYVASVRNVPHDQIRTIQEVTKKESR